MSVIHPFDESGIVRDASGVARYQGLQPSLVAMLLRVSRAVAKIRGHC